MRMGSNLRNLFNNKVKIRTIPVEHEVDAMVPSLDKDGKERLDAKGEVILKKGRVTETYVMEGMPDNHWVNLKAIDNNKLLAFGGVYSTHLTERGTIATFTAEEVFQVMLVTHFLQAPEGEEPYSEVDIAIVAKEHGFLFGKLVGAANQIIQNLDDPEAADPLLAVGLGNSKSPGTESLSSPASTPSASSPAQS